MKAKARFVGVSEVRQTRSLGVINHFESERYVDKLVGIKASPYEKLKRSIAQKHTQNSPMTSQLGPNGELWIRFMYHP